MEPAAFALQPVRSGAFTFDSENGFCAAKIPRESAHRILELLFPEEFCANDLEDALSATRTIVKKPWIAGQLKHYGIPFEVAESVKQLRTTLEESVRTGKCDRVPQHIQAIEAGLRARFQAGTQLHANVNANANANVGGNFQGMDSSVNKPQPYEGSGNMAYGWAPPTQQLTPIEQQTYVQPMAVEGTIIDDSTSNTIKPKKGRGRPRKIEETPSANNTTTGLPPRKRGRPRKERDPNAISAEPPRKRGRPRKEPLTEDREQQQPSTAESTTPKKRGRPSKLGPPVGAAASTAPIIKSNTPGLRNAMTPPFNLGHAVGYYRIKCEAISSQWSNNNEMYLNIVPGKNLGDGLLFGEFDFGVIEGVMRLAPSMDDIELSSISDNDNSGGYDYDGQRTTNISVPQAASEPLSNRFQLLWRGAETGDGVILLAASHQHRGYVDFWRSETGSMLKGVVNLDFVGEQVVFSGELIGFPRNLHKQWENYSEAAYERARVARWH